MADGGPWLMSLWGECVLVVEADTRWKMTMEGKQRIPLSFQIHNWTTSISFSVYVGISNTPLRGPHVKPDQNNKWIIMYGVTLLDWFYGLIHSFHSFFHAMIRNRWWYTYMCFCGVSCKHDRSVNSVWRPSLPQFYGRILKSVTPFCESRKRVTQFISRS